jgi:hypothetical protein
MPNCESPFNAARLIRLCSRPTISEIHHLDGHHSAADVAITRILTRNVDAKADFVCHLEIKKFEDSSVNVDDNKNQ